MKNVSYQSIFNILQEILPDNWHKVVFYAEYGESSYSMKYFVDFGDGQYIDCFRLKGITKIMPIRKELSKKDTWTVMTLVVDENGNFKADYEYKDISEDLVGYYNGWKNRYLR